MFIIFVDSRQTANEDVFNSVECVEVCSATSLYNITVTTSTNVISRLQQQQQQQQRQEENRLK